MSDDDTLVDELAAEIREYLDQNPHAADTLDGIVQWWIVQQRFLRGLHAAGRAVKRLIEQGRMEELLTPDGQVIFRAVRQQGNGPA
jgi:hypothetical protein